MEITRTEKLLTAIIDGEQPGFEPYTRREIYLAAIAGADVKLPDPFTREEILLHEIAENGIGGSAPVVEPLSVTENGTYTAPSGVDGYNPVTVNVASGGSEMEEQYIRMIERDSSKPLTKLPEGLTKIGSYAFYSYTNLALTSLPDGVTSIGDYAFGACINLALAELPAGVTSIGKIAFMGCINLALAELPAGVTSIGNSAFQDCSRLAAITFKGTPSSISSTAFKNCTGIKTINVPWAEGEVANAPWGATNATINYNYTGG